VTNEQLLTANVRNLDHHERQRRYILEDAGLPDACPVCGFGQNKFEAGQVAINAYDFGVTRVPYTCLRCEVPLDPAVPLVLTGGRSWFWRRDFSRPWSRDPLSAAWPVATVEG
jgi:hypothetical protein